MAFLVNNLGGVAISNFTTKPLTSTQSSAEKNPSYDMMIILVFSGSFMAVLIICLALGCREQRARQRGLYISISCTVVSFTRQQ